MSRSELHIFSSEDSSPKSKAKMAKFEEVLDVSLVP